MCVGVGEPPVASAISNMLFFWGTPPRPTLYYRPDITLDALSGAESIQPSNQSVRLTRLA